MALILDCGGPIAQVAMSLPAEFLRDGSEANWFRPLVPVGNLLKSLPAGTEAVLLIDKAYEAEIEGWIGGLSLSCRVLLVPMADDDPAFRSPWLQDAFHVRAQYSIEPAEILTLEGKPEGAKLAAFLNLPARPVQTDLQGGNQLVGPDFRVIGQHSLVSPVGEQPYSQIKALDERAVKIFGYPAGGLGDGHPERLHQFGFHVDQFVSVTGLARDGRPLLMVAEPHLLEEAGTHVIRDARDKLETSANFLRRQGFEVIRNPVPWVVTPDSGKRLPRLYNNIMLENEIRRGNQRPLVWLPQFSDVEPLETFDCMNREIWESLGFEIVPIFGWSYFASRNGALRCATKVLRRL